MTPSFFGGPSESPWVKLGETSGVFVFFCFLCHIDFDSNHLIVQELICSGTKFGKITPIAKEKE